MPETNGTGLKQDIEKRLTQEPLTRGYVPTLPLWAMYTDAAYLPQIYLLRDIELMLTHPKVRSALDYFKGGLATAEPQCTEASSPEIMSFAQDHIKRFWEQGMPLAQEGYDYGWMGLEAQYKEQDNYLKWDYMLQFSPRDVFLLTQDFNPVGVRVKHVPEKGSVDLWMATEDVPAKGLWYAHQPRHNRHYGQSQLLPAWRPWRRLAWKDAAETVTDTGVYRFAYCGPEVRYPEEDIQISVAAGMSSPGTTMDDQGRPRRYARDYARFIAEQFKAGAGIGVPSTQYPPESGGGPKWEVKFPASTLNVSGLIEYIKYLEDQISYGIGVPPELLAAAETGSGYSGRKLPMQAFLMRQQRIANAMLKMFVDQVLRPLVRWNFGLGATFKAEVPNILKAAMQDASGASVAEGVGERPDQMPGPQNPLGQSPLGGSQPKEVPQTSGQFSLNDERRKRLKAMIARIRRAA